MLDYCSQCGAARINGNAGFCPECGKPFEEANGQASQPNPIGPQPSFPPPQDGMTQEQIAMMYPAHYQMLRNQHGQSCPEASRLQMEQAPIDAQQVPFIPQPQMTDRRNDDGQQHGVYISPEQFAQYQHQPFEAQKPMP